MLVSLTAAYAAVLALLMTALAINVTVHRVKLGVPVGDGGNPRMLRMIRLHGNAAEYIPLGLLLMLVYEVNGGAPMVLHIAGIALVAGRLLQTWGMWATPEPNFGAHQRAKPDLADDCGAGGAESVADRITA